MKIEKISESQVKFILNKSDLSERNLKLTEFQYGSEKTQALFREMMEQAMLQFDFHTDNTPLMIEAVPVSNDSIMVIVTKVAQGAETEDKFGILPDSKEKDRYHSIDIIEPPSENVNEDSISIYSFATLDEVTQLSLRLQGSFTGTNLLFKNNRKYFLMLQNNSPDDKLTTEALEAVLGEYGQKHTSTIISKYYLSEHGELLVNHPAIDILAEHLG